MRAGILTACLMAVAFSAWAQQPPSDTIPHLVPRDSTKKDSVLALPTIEVVGSIAPVAGPTISSGIPAQLSTVSAEQIDAWEPRTLADALASQGGVSTYDDMGSSYKLTVMSRGFFAGPTAGLPQGISVFLDGVRQNEPDASEVNFDLLPLEHIKRIELLSGNGSLLGPNSLGGAINLVTRRGEGPPSGEVELSGGSYGNVGIEGNVAGQSKSGWDYYVGGGYEREDGWRQATGAHNYNGFLNLGRRSESGSWRFQLLGADSRAETAGSLPESIFNTDPQVNFTPGDYDNLKQIQGSFSGFLSRGMSRFGLTVYGRYTHAEHFNVNQVPDPDIRNFSKTGVFGGNFDYRWSHLFTSAVLSLRGGLDANGNVTDVIIHNELGGTDSVSTNAHSPGFDIAPYAMADYTVGRVTLSGGLRFDYIKIPFHNLLDPAEDTTSSYTRLSPRAGISVSLGRGWSTYGSWGQSFRAPALLELTCADPTASCPLPFALGEDPPLKPVVARTGEVGVKMAKPFGRIGASLYYTTVHDDIYFVSSTLVTGYFSNIPETRRAGAQVDGEFFLSGGHTIYANYAWTQATFQSRVAISSQIGDLGGPGAGPDNTTHPGSKIPLVPEHVARAGATFVLPARFTTGADLRLTGPQWLRGDEANNTSPLDSYFTADVRLGWRVGRWELSGVASNLFDARGPVFGTFNENGQTGEVERFLTPASHRAFKVIVRVGIGANPQE
ncbi:MAG TPA: TonB-dependent receptor [Gemmatimonadales bacterium]|nr:TonB-dependent receptor [Gemmatimonadales bacterium]